MTSSLRKFLLTAHITTSVGWLGAVAAYLTLAVTGLTSNDGQLARAAYLSMWLMGWYLIVPLSLAAMLVGLVQSLATRWGLIRHYWIVTKVVLTTVATIVLLKHMTAVGQMADIAAATSLSAGDFRELREQLVVHPAGGLLVLLTAAILSVYRPWGLTPYGRRLAGQADVPVELDSSAGARVQLIRRPLVRRPRWVYIVGIHAVALVVLAIVLHLAGGRLPGH